MRKGAAEAIVGLFPRLRQPVKKEDVQGMGDNYNFPVDRVTFSAPMQRVLVEQVVRHCSGNEPIRILDTGCGTGTNGIEIALSICHSTNGEVPIICHLTDISPFKIDDPRIRIIDSDPRLNIKLVVEGADGKSLHYPPEFFDAVNASNWLHFGAVCPNSLRQIMFGFISCLKPGGVLQIGNVCTIHNNCCIGNDSDPKARDQMIGLLEGAFRHFDDQEWMCQHKTVVDPLGFCVYRESVGLTPNRTMAFFFSWGLKILMRDYGLNVVGTDREANLFHPNGRSDGYPENIFVVATKPYGRMRLSRDLLP